MFKKAVSEDPTTSNIENGPQHCLNLQNSTFIRFIDQYERN